MRCTCRAAIGLLACMALYASSASAQGTVPLAFVQPLSPAAITEVQQRLKQNGVYGGQVDGLWGADSQAALDRFQQGRGLQATGSINHATATLLGLSSAALVAGAPDGAARTSVSASSGPLNASAVRNIQQRLRARGFYRGAADGVWGPGTQQALERFQQGQGLQANGQVNPATIQALGLDPNSLGTAPQPQR